MKEENGLLEIKYVQAPNYTTGHAGIVIAAGPTGDGMVHLHFVREVVGLQSESVMKTVVGSTDGQNAEIFRLSPIEGRPITTDLYREIVATIAMPAASLRNVARTLLNVADTVEGNSRAASVSGAAESGAGNKRIN